MGEAKECRKCGTAKPLDEFWAGNGPHGRQSYCKPCLTESNRINRRKARRRNPERAYMQAREYGLRQNYSMTLERFDEMLAAQDGACAICGSTEPGGGRKHMAVDHDHATGQVRALLCNPCNRGIGLLGDDAARVRAAALYLERHSA